MASTSNYGGQNTVGKAKQTLDDDVAEAIEALRAIPSHMSYNITLIDRNCEWATVFVAPDRPSIVMPTPWSVNHQLGNEWPRHCRKSNTLKRGAHLKSLYASHPPSGAELATEFSPRAAIFIRL